MSAVRQAWLALALVSGLGALGLALHEPVVRASVDPAPVVALGDYGLGEPLASEVEACPGEVIYSPVSDTWTCEAQG